MPIVFLCPTGTYASLVGANLLIGKLNQDSKLEAILNLPNFGGFIGKPGIFLYIGKDLSGNMVYTLSICNEAQLIKKSAYDFLRILNFDLRKLKIYDVSRFVPKYLIWCNSIFPRQSKTIIAKKLYQQLAEIDKEMGY